MPLPRLIAALVFGAGSLIFITTALALVGRAVWVLRVGRRVRGQCVNVYVDPIPGHRLQDRWVSVVSFAAPDGVRYRLTVVNGGHTLGEWVPVLVPPSAPERAQVAQPWVLWRWPIALGLISIVFVLAMVGLLRMS